jgi:DNA-binding NtrC family response regulator
MNAVSTQMRAAALSLVVAELAFPESAQGDAVSVIRRVATLRPGIPILVLTSNANPGSHREARSMGAWDISVKPILSTELLSLTENILDEAYPERSGRLGRSMVDVRARE